MHASLGAPAIGQPLSHLGDSLSLSGVLRTTPWWSSVTQMTLVTRLPWTPRGETRVRAGQAMIPWLLFSLPPLLPTEVGLVQFHEPGIFNYSALLMSEDKDTLYVGARETVFALNALDISEKRHEVGPAPSLPALRTPFCPYLYTDLAQDSTSEVTQEKSRLFLCLICIVYACIYMVTLKRMRE